MANPALQQAVKMPVAFKTTKTLCKLFEIIMSGGYGTRTQISDLVVNRAQMPGLHLGLSSVVGVGSGLMMGSSNLNNNNVGSMNMNSNMMMKDLGKPEHHFSVFFQKVFYAKFYKEDRRTLKALFQRLYENGGPANKLQLAFIYMIQKSLDLMQIDSLPLGLAGPINEVLRQLRLSPQTELFQQIPKLGF